MTSGVIIELIITRCVIQLFSGPCQCSEITPIPTPTDFTPGKQPKQSCVVVLAMIPIDEQSLGVSEHWQRGILCCLSQLSK